MQQASDEDDYELIWDWSGDGTAVDTRKDRIAPHNLVILPSADHRLIILHDSECFHRVPLAALHRQPIRSIVRVEFHGLDHQGTKVAFARSQRNAWKAVGPLSIPTSLATLCDEYARARQTYGLSEHESQKAVSDGLQAYVAADDRKVGLRDWLAERLTSK